MDTVLQLCNVALIGVLNCFSNFISKKTFVINGETSVNYKTAAQLRKLLLIHCDELWSG